MNQYLGLLTTVIFLSVLPGTSWAQNSAGIPPMLETQRPLAMPVQQPEPRAPQAEPAKAVSRATKGEKGKKAQRQKSGAGKTNLADHKKTKKTVKKKGATAKPKSKVAASQ